MLQYPVTLDGDDARLALVANAINERLSRSPCTYLKVMSEEIAGLSGLARADVVTLLMPFGGTNSGIAIANRKTDRAS